MGSIELPKSNLPVYVIQLYLGNDPSKREPAIVGKEFNDKFGNIIMAVLTERGIQVVESIDDLTEEKRPGLNGSEYQITGMGMYYGFVKGKHQFGGKSWEYNKGIDKDHLKQLQQRNSDFDFEVLDDL